jgi:hypothetical protein
MNVCQQILALDARFNTYRAQSSPQHSKYDYKDNSSVLHVFHSFSDTFMFLILFIRNIVYTKTNSVAERNSKEKCEYIMVVVPSVDLKVWRRWSNLIFSLDWPQCSQTLLVHKKIDFKQTTWSRSSISEVHMYLTLSFNCMLTLPSAVYRSRSTSIPSRISSVEVSLQVFLKIQNW